MLLLLGLTLMMSGCTKINEEIPKEKKDQTLMTSSPSPKVDASKIASPESVEASDHTTILKQLDIDQNGEDDRIQLIEKEAGWDLEIYLNGERIYHYLDENNIMGIDQVAYFDINGDSKKEIFVSFSPNVNSMPLEEWEN